MAKSFSPYHAPNVGELAHARIIKIIQDVNPLTAQRLGVRRKEKIMAKWESYRCACGTTVNGRTERMYPSPADPDTIDVICPNCGNIIPLNRVKKEAPDAR